MGVRMPAAIAPASSIGSCSAPTRAFAIVARASRTNSGATTPRPRRVSTGARSTRTPLISSSRGREES